MPTLTELYEENNFKALSTRVVLAGHTLSPRPIEISYSYRIGEVPTCSLKLRVQPTPVWLVRGASIQVYAGFDNVMIPVFTGEVKTVSHLISSVTVECAGMMNRLDRPYKRDVLTADGIKTATVLIEEIFAAAGIFNYAVNLTPPSGEADWIPGEATVAQGPIEIEMSTYLEGANKILEVFDSPVYELPAGQIRAERLDPIPADGFFREYFSGVLDGPVMSRPPGVSNSSAYPRIRDGSFDEMIDDVYNQVFVRGRQIESTGPEGEVNRDVIETDASADSPWIDPVYPGFIDYVFSNDLIDSPVIAGEVALRYLYLLNRLNEVGRLTIEGDPQIFLGATVFVRDLVYTGKIAPYFVEGYSTTITDRDFVTNLQLIGGINAGTQGFLSPFADFIWRNQYVPIQPTVVDENGREVSPVAAKAIQYVPGEAGRRVIITFDSSPSHDADGQIVVALNEWFDSLGNTQTGGRFWTETYDPEEAGSVDVTLRVYDDTGRSDEITKTVYINTTSPIDGYATSNDAEQGGGYAYEQNPIGIDEDGDIQYSPDGGENWITIDLSVLGLEGAPVPIDVSMVNVDCGFILFAGTTAGEIIRATGPDFDDVKVVARLAGAPAIVEFTKSEDPDALNGIAYWVKADRNGGHFIGKILPRTDLLDDQGYVPTGSIGATASYLLLVIHDFDSTLTTATVRIVGTDFNSDPYQEDVIVTGKGAYISNVKFLTVTDIDTLAGVATLSGDEEISLGTARDPNLDPDYVVYRSMDGGFTWSPVPLQWYPDTSEETTPVDEEAPVDMEGMDCGEGGFEPQVMWEQGQQGVYLGLCGGTLYKTTDNGVTWAPYDVGSPLVSIDVVPCIIRGPAVELYAIVEGDDEIEIESTTPNSFFDTDTGIVIQGTGFGAAQGTGKVELSDTSDYGDGTLVEQTVTDWTGSDITFTAVQGALLSGPVYVFVTNNNGAVSNGDAVLLL